MKKILVLDGHPGTQKFCTALATRYAQGAQEAGAQVELLHLSQIKFNPNLNEGFSEEVPLEPALLDLQAKILWCDHLMVVYPTWWAGMPAQLKGLFDRVMLPGFAFRYRKDSSLWDKLLKGRSAHVTTTMDTPAWVDRFYMRRAGLRMLSQGILSFCGFSPVTQSVIGSVRKLNNAQIQKCLDKMQALGKRHGRKIN
jgi:NAD(P)H dehydrogenase (quinone)